MQSQFKVEQNTLFSRRAFFDETTHRTIIAACIT